MNFERAIYECLNFFLGGGMGSKIIIEISLKHDVEKFNEITLFATGLVCQIS